jgi:hypothetical protein
VRTHRHTDTVLDCTVSRLERTPTAIDLNSIIFSLARPIRWGVPDGTTKKEKEKETRRSERRTVWVYKKKKNERNARWIISRRRRRELLCAQRDHSARAGLGDTPFSF